MYSSLLISVGSINRYAYIYALVSRLAPNARYATSHLHPSRSRPHYLPPHRNLSHTDQTLALLGAIVRRNFLFSSVSSITGNIPLSLNPAKNSCPYAYPT